MEILTKNLLWLAGCLIGLLMVYMAYAHQMIRWQRERGLLARQSHGLYWMILGFAKTYAWLLAVIILMVLAGIVYTAVYGEPRQTSLFGFGRTVSQNLPQAESGDREFGELEKWTTQLEERRLQFPQDYCSRVQRGIAAYAQIKEPSSIIKLKRRYLDAEYQKYCPA